MGEGGELARDLLEQLPGAAEEERRGGVVAGVSGEQVAPGGHRLDVGDGGCGVLGQDPVGRGGTLGEALGAEQGGRAGGLETGRHLVPAGFRVEVLRDDPQYRGGEADRDQPVREPGPVHPVQLRVPPVGRGHPPPGGRGQLVGQVRRQLRPVGVQPGLLHQ